MSGKDNEVVMLHYTGCECGQEEENTDVSAVVQDDVAFALLLLLFFFLAQAFKDQTDSIN